MTRRIPPDIESSVYDAMVIGAGINGCGIARDAAMRGLRVLLLDKGDIAGGTTSWSTRLIHGGLRYLEYGEVGLVRESLRERERLLHIAPHLVRPLPLLIPIYEGARRGPWLIRAGMIAYDLLSFDKSLDHHHMLTRQQALARAPGLNPAGLRGAAVYYDAQVEYAERLAVENALSAVENRADVLTYARVERLLWRGAAVEGAEVKDLLGGGTMRVRARVTVNVAGPWVDQVLAGSPRPTPRMIGGTKGSHIVVEPFAGAPRDALYVEAHEDQRPFFIIPWNRLYLIGTTDVRFEGDLDQVEADESEIDYLIRETNRVIPAARLTRDAVLYTYSGVRPLPFVRDGAEAGITRRHFIHDHTPDASNLLSIVGGKLTTYRELAEQTVNRIFRKLGRRAPACPTAQVKLPGAAGAGLAALKSQFTAGGCVPQETGERLLRVYGTRARSVLAIASECPSLLEPFSPETGAIGAEVIFSFRHELAQTLGDCLLRRTMVGLGPLAGLGADASAARIAQQHLGWSPDRAAQEIAAYRKRIERFHPRQASVEYS
jgi:glycerol-3-phosphate dehydrogenase